LARLKNRRHEKYAQEVALSGNKKQSYSSVYPLAGKSSLEVAPYRLFNRKDIQDRINEILNNREESRLESVIEQVTGDLQAKKEVIYNSKGDIKEVRDNPTRQGAQEKLLKLHKAPGFVKQETNIVNNDNRAINISTEDIKQLGSILVELKQLNADMQLGECLQSGEVIDLSPSDSDELTNDTKLVS